MSKTLLILNDPPYGSERCYNALRLAAMLARTEALVGVYGTCMDARGIEDGELIQGAHRGTMEQLAAWTQWADKVLVF